ncbi:MAG: hypothetical protein JWL80_628 [Parcubacteria group bacterium]|nr:hypothetical protein [Parcubacteria group bacterium]
MNNLVYIDEYGLLGSNFYWHKYEAKGLSKEDILEAGLTSDRVQVHKDIIEQLVAIDKEFQNHGYRLYIKEGYRSMALYNIVYKRRIEKFGKEETDRLLNMNDMPHATGKTVDVALWNEKENREVFLRNGEDGIDALFVDFYKNREGEQSEVFQDLQDMVIQTMMSHGFRLGTKNEYFHFDYNL